jgi:hypothetical protein
MLDAFLPCIRELMLCHVAAIFIVLMCALGIVPVVVVTHSLMLDPRLTLEGCMLLVTSLVLCVHCTASAFHMMMYVIIPLSIGANE